MNIPMVAKFGVGGVLVAAIATGVLADGQIGQPPNDDPVSKYELLGQFLDTNPRAGIYEEEDARIARVYGQAFSHGDTADASAEAFINQWSGIWGIDAQELDPTGPFPDGHHEQPIMYDPATDSYKFTGKYYRQMHDGVPVFGSKLGLLIRNEPGFPLVLASSDLRDLGDFNGGVEAITIDDAALTVRAERLLGPGAQISDVEAVIFAGYDLQPHTPVAAITFIATNGGPAGMQKYKYVVEADTLRVVFEEDQIFYADLEVSVSGLATDGLGADICDPETEMGLAYARVVVDGNVFYANADGQLTVPLLPPDPILVQSAVRGQWFRVFNQAGADTTMSEMATPGVDTPMFLYNSANNSELLRAEVNAYVQSNLVRDFILGYNPSYPTIANQTEFTVNVNVNSNCNATYSGDAINFYTSGGGCPNTANATIVHHEYGHHLVNVGGSGQGAYGEGTGDTIGVLITGQSELAIGFFNDCGSGLRDAENDCDYSPSDCSTCGSAIHTCGQLISGCVWETFQQLMLTMTLDEARDVLAPLAINAILLHNGTSITPAITIDYLTLDDDNGDIGDGTPHYAQINAGFTDHNMPGPPLSLLGFEFPDGLPDTVDNDGGTTARVEVVGVTQSPAPGTGTLVVDPGTGFVAIPMDIVSPNVYDAVFPASDCGTLLQYYFVAETTTGTAQTFPSNAPAEALSVLSADTVEVAINDDFETNMGWTVQNSVADGQWERGVPAGGGDRGDPPTDADGSGQCYITDNADGNSDVDGGTTTLISPVFDGTIENATLSYYRWYSNTFGAAPESDIFVVEISNNGGTTWTNLETVGPTGPEVDGEWFLVEFNIADFVTPTDQIRIRFLASDLGDGSVVEAGVDGVQMLSVSCDDDGGPCDPTGDGVVNVDDLLLVLAEWGPCDECGGDTNNDGVVDVNDLLAVLGSWGPCP